MQKDNFCRIVNWYPVLGEYSLRTVFLKLTAEDVKLLADGVGNGEAAASVISRLKNVMRGGALDNYFISADLCRTFSWICDSRRAVRFPFRSDDRGD